MKPAMNEPDAQDEAEMFDEETRGEDETVVEDAVPDDGYVHGNIVAPDQLLADDIAELIAAEQPAEDPLSAEEAAMHYEEH